MNTRLHRSMMLVAVAALIAFGAPRSADASPVPASMVAKLELPKLKAPKLLPKVKFKASGKLDKTTARIHLYADLSFAGKTKKISIFNMGVKKKGKSVQVNRKIGKLKVSLKVSWTGTRTITISGTARYLKFKVPVPKIRVKL